MYTIKIIESGYIMADGGAMFGAIPKRAWMRKYPSDKNNLCKLAMRCLLVVSDKRKILVDLGIGNKHNEQISYYQPENLIDFGETLLSMGYATDDITDVVLTHLHFDHCGAATFYDGNKKAVPSFPNATYWISDTQWSNLLLPNPLEKDSLFAENVQPIFDAGLVHLITEDTQIDSDFELKLFNGHSVGQLLPIIKTENDTIAFPSDLIPTAAHNSLEWISAYDINPLVSYTEKKRFLNEAVENDYTLIYYHDSDIIQSKVRRLNDNFKATKSVHR